MKFFEICAEVLVPKYTRAEVRLSAIRSADVGGQHCPCHVLVSFQSGFPGKSCPMSVCCPYFLSGACLFGFCLTRFYQLSGFCQDFAKKAVRCLSVRSDKDETEVNSERCPDFWYDCPPTPDGQSLTASVFNATDLLGTKCF